LKINQVEGPSSPSDCRWSPSAGRDESCDPSRRIF
jgi:hypothetical protein